MDDTCFNNCPRLFDKITAKKNSDLCPNALITLELPE